MNRLLWLLLLTLTLWQSAFAQATPDFVTVTFNVSPPGSKIEFHNSGKQAAYVGLTGQPVRVDKRWLGNGSIEVTFARDGYEVWQESIPSGLLREGATWPDHGKSVKLQPANAWVAVRDSLGEHSFLYGFLGLVTLGVIVYGANRRKLVPAEASAADASQELASPADQLSHSLERLGYTMLRQLGRGGNATVYEVEKNGNSERLALKLLDVVSSNDVESMQRIRREIKIWRELVHPSIVPLYDFGDIQGRYYLVMEKVDGISLRDRLQQGPLPLRDALVHMDTLLDAIGYANRSGIVHRDLKPENIMLRVDGRLQVLDFGTCRNLNHATMITVGDSVAGTPAYMSPERWSGDTGPGVDQYALGIIFYELLTGEHPIGTDNDIPVILHKQLYLQPESTRTHRPEIPVEMDRLVMRMLEKSPANRFADLLEARQALHEFLAAPSPV